MRKFPSFFEENFFRGFVTLLGPFEEYKLDFFAKSWHEVQYHVVRRLRIGLADSTLHIFPKDSVAPNDV